MPPAPTAVRFTGVTKRFGEFTAVDRLDLEARRGEIFGILGPNGAGKTTSIRLLMNIFGADEGHVEVLGEAMNEELKARLGYLPEERGLYKKMRVREILRFFGRIKGRDRAFLDPRVDSWVERMGLSAWRDRRVEELSKGMAQKVQFLATVVHEPELVVLDEPFAGLDPVNRDVLRDVVLDLRRQGVTIVFSTHVMEQAEALCDRIVLIHRGRVRLSGTLAEVRATQGREAAFARFDDAGRGAERDAAGRGANGGRFAGLPGVESVADHGNEAELHLGRGADTNEIVRTLLGRGTLRSFEVRAPSLHEIFKRVVGAQGEGGAEGRGGTGGAGGEGGGAP
jgi:ABC-2 type transport system ATP-binding protein